MLVTQDVVATNARLDAMIGQARNEKELAEEYVELARQRVEKAEQALKDAEQDYYELVDMLRRSKSALLNLERMRTLLEESEELLKQNATC